MKVWVAKLMESYYGLVEMEIYLNEEDAVKAATAMAQKAHHGEELTVITNYGGRANETRVVCKRNIEDFFPGDSESIVTLMEVKESYE